MLGWFMFSQRKWFEKTLKSTQLPSESLLVEGVVGLVELLSLFYVYIPETSDFQRKAMGGLVQVIFRISI